MSGYFWLGHEISDYVRLIQIKPSYFRLRQVRSGYFMFG